MFNDWDFSHEGRIRQSHRMHDLASKLKGDYTICDFVAPLEEMRTIFAADYTVWVDTINRGRYEDTNKVFIPPNEYNTRVTEQDAIKWAEIIARDINSRLK
jgi:adenylylsulfate kinase